MIFEEQHIAGVFLITHDYLGDERGGFFRSYCKGEFQHVNGKPWVQMNHSFNSKKGTLRGLHFQRAPHSEQKQIRCIRGEIQDVFVDLRSNSRTFLKWGSVRLSSKNNQSLFLPEGIAHGFVTLEDETELLYNHTNFYNPEFEGGLRYDDPMIGIQWTIEPQIISDRDKNHPYLDQTFQGLRL